MSRDANQVSNATKFSPERWLKTSEDASKQSCPHKIHPFVVLPFGYGRRTCLGKRFAMAELQIILAKVKILTCKIAFICIKICNIFF